MLSRRLVLTILMCSIWLGGTPAGAAGPNQLPNGSFEESSGDPATPFGWMRQAWTPGASLTWDADQAHDGLLSARVSNPSPNDAAWTQTITLEPDRNYLLSGWIKTENVAHVTEGVDAGANLCVWGTWLRTPALTGTNDWTYMSAWSSTRVPRASSRSAAGSDTGRASPPAPRGSMTFRCARSWQRIHTRAGRSSC